MVRPVPGRSAYRAKRNAGKRAGFCRAGLQNRPVVGCPRKQSQNLTTGRVYRLGRERGGPLYFRAACAASLLQSAHVYLGGVVDAKLEGDLAFLAGFEVEGPLEQAFGVGLQVFGIGARCLTTIFSLRETGNRSWSAMRSAIFLLFCTLRRNS